MEFLIGIWEFFANNILTKPAYLIDACCTWTWPVVKTALIFVYFLNLTNKRFITKAMRADGKKLDDIKFPGFLSIFNENIVATSCLMFIFFGIILS